MHCAWLIFILNYAILFNYLTLPNYNFKSKVYSLQVLKRHETQLFATYGLKAESLFNISYPASSSLLHAFFRRLGSPSLGVSVRASLSHR